jgi:crotonobetainyl-CoA:carnitine CoA-transferase CaiB-like acyl-CoA transferase
MDALPLEGVVVVELGDSASAPFAGKALAELGAEVWKVERPSGDSSRGWGPSSWEGSGASFYGLNRGKKLVSIDIKDPEQLEQLQRFIITRADVFLHNLRPGTSARYGLDAEALRTAKPDLIHCEVGAFGHTGAMSTLPGYDPLMQAFAGIMSLMGEEGQPPVRAGVSIVDFGTGMWAVIGILAALFRRERKSMGASVDTSLLESALAWMTVGIANYNTDGDVGGRFGSGVGFIVPHRAYSTADGELVVGCANDALFAGLCEVLEHPEWATDPRFATNQGRLRNRHEIDRLIGEVLATRTRAHWMEVLGARGVPAAPVQTVDEIVAHPQTAALGIIEDAEDGRGPRLVGLPVSFDGERPPAGRQASGVGADNDEFQRRLDG